MGIVHPQAPFPLHHMPRNYFLAKTFVPSFSNRLLPSLNARLLRLINTLHRCWDVKLVDEFDNGNTIALHNVAVGEYGIG
jgi:hypothetical protein